MAVGCFTEIIQWRKRVFVPTGERAAGVLAAVIGILGNESKAIWLIPIALSILPFAGKILSLTLA